MKNSRLLIYLFPAILLMLPGTLFAYGYRNLLSGGTPLPGIHAISLGLGGARAVGFGDAASIFLNPADIYRIPGSSFSMSIGGAVMNEIITNSLGKTTTNSVAMGNALAAFKLQPTLSVSIGAGIARITDTSYDGRFYVYETEPPEIGKILADSSLKASGGLWESVAGTACRITPWLNVGVSAGIRFGGGDLNYEYTDREEAINDTSYTISWDENTFCYHAGLMFPFELTSVGLSYASGSDMYTDKLAFGAIFYTDRSNQGAFGIEGEIESVGEDNIFTGRLLGRFSPEGSLRFRGGFSFTDMGEESGGANLGVSLGVSIGFGRFIIDSAFSMQSNSRTGNVFGYSGEEDVKDTPSFITIGLTWNP